MPSFPEITASQREALQTCIRTLDATTDGELVQLALTLDPESANMVLVHFGGLKGLFKASPSEALGFLGLERLPALQALRVAVELVRRAQTTPLARGVPYGSSRDIERAFKARLEELTEEHFLVVLLDGRQRPLCELKLAEGTASACPVNIRKVFAAAVREGASGFVAIHNHPSGDSTPSPEDLSFTRAMADAGRTLELPLIDHVIISRNGSFSFLDSGLLPSERSATSRRGA